MGWLSDIIVFHLNDKNKKIRIIIANNTLKDTKNMLTQKYKKSKKYDKLY